MEGPHVEMFPQMKPSVKGVGGVWAGNKPGAVSWYGFGGYVKFKQKCKECTQIGSHQENKVSASWWLV